MLDELKVVIEVASVDSYQGRESDIVVYAACRANIERNVGFLSKHLLI